MSVKDLLYLSYKYYFASSEMPESAMVKAHFKPMGQRPEHTTLLTISIGGDLMPYKLVSPSNSETLWEHVGTDFFGSDIVFANLETPIDLNRPAGFVPEVMLNDMHFNANLDMMQVFSGMGQFKGYDVLSVCNNHSLDQGVEGLDASMQYLHSQHIRTVGAKLTQDAMAYSIIEQQGVKVGFVAYTFSLNQFDRPIDQPWKVNALRLNTAQADITELIQEVAACRAAGAEFIVCSLHCGNAYQAYPSEVTVDLFKRVFVATEVDVIAGSHPHNLQPWTFYDYTSKRDGQLKKGFAIYSLADFIAYDIYTWCHLSAYLKVELYRDSEGQIRFWPIVRPMLMSYQNKALELHYAEEVFAKSVLSSEEKDLKRLYDICVHAFNATTV